MDAKVEFVTPKMAETFLHCSAPNRPVRRSHVDFLAGVMQRGEWKSNGEAIIFDSHGKMIDGQHRCHAVIKAGRGVKSLVVRGVENGSFETIDRGVGRSNSDALFIAGEKNYARLSAMLKVIVDVERQELHNPQKISSAEQQQALEAHPSAREWAARARAVSNALTGAVQICAVLCLLEEKFDQPARAFYASLASGADLPSGSPILALRNRLASDPSLRVGTRAVREYILALFARAWNGWVRDEKIQRLADSRKDSVYDLLEPKHDAK